jgi:hypothetical protein
LRRATIALCLCGQPVALHFDARNRKLDCARVLDKADAIRRARRDARKLARYIKRLESV